MSKGPAVGEPSRPYRDLVENALWSVVTQLPIIVALIIGTVMLAVSRSRLPGRSVIMGMVGIGLTAVSVIMWVFWALIAQTFADNAVDSFTLIYNTVSTIINVVAGVGLLLLVLGICGAAATRVVPQPAFPPSTVVTPPQ